MKVWVVTSGDDDQFHGVFQTEKGAKAWVDDYCTFPQMRAWFTIKEEVVV